MASDLIAHVEIPTKDLDKSKEFFHKLFSWEFKSFGNGYLLFNTHKGFTVGLKNVKEIASGESTIFHIKVDDISSMLKTTVELGGKVFREKTTIPAMGYYALIKDIDGNTIGLYQKNV